MAKRKKRVRNSQQNKSLAIRQYKADFPEAMPKEIAEALSRKGFDVSAQYVSTILSNERRANGRTGRSPAAGQFTLPDLHLAKQLVLSTGGVKEAHLAVDCYAKLIVAP